MTEEQKTKFKNTILEQFQESIFNLKIEQGFDIQRINDKEMAQRLDDLQKEAKDLESLIETLEKTPSRGKEAKLAKENLNRQKINLEGVKFKINKILISRSDIYKAIDERSRKIESVKKMMEYVSTFEIDNLPELPFFEIAMAPDGKGNQNLGITRYASKNNQVERTEDGVPVLYLKPAENDKSN